MARGDSDDDDNDGNDTDYFIPIVDQRVFGAGISKKGIKFVPATDQDASITTGRSAVEVGKSNAGERYLSIVLGANKSSEPSDVTDDLSIQNEIQKGGMDLRGEVLCAVCGQIVANPNSQEGTEGGDDKATASAAATAVHQSSIAHQVCMQHSHPPSHLDREHVGLKYLSGYGWDPDARQGLGARQEGLRIPIKAKEKRDTAGLGVNTNPDDDDADGGYFKDGFLKRKPVKPKAVKIVKVDAKELRRLEHEKKKKAEKMRHAFYGEDLSPYLGPDT